MKAAALIARGIDGKLIAVACERPSEALAELVLLRKSGCVGKVKVSEAVVITTEHMAPIGKFRAVKVAAK